LLVKFGIRISGRPGAWIPGNEPLPEGAVYVGIEPLKRGPIRWDGTVDKSRKLLFPVEVKSQQSISDWDFQVLERAFGKGWLITPDTNRVRPKSEALSLENFFLRQSTH
ncbi:hypothetical protein WDW86_19760, partial [Bdellovibrionota bacterium FG-2]